jgi:hypothetical protein
VTARLRSDAALYQPAPSPTGRPGRPRVKGHRLPELIVIAAMTRYRWTPVQVRCYGTTLEREVLAIRCLWYGALKGQLVQVVLSRPLGAPDGYELAWSPPTLAPPPRRSSNATATAGRQRLHPLTPDISPASAKPAPVPNAQSPVWCRSGWSA